MRGGTALSRTADLGDVSNQQWLTATTWILVCGADRLAVVLREEHILISTFPTVDELDALSLGAVEVPASQMRVAVSLHER